MDYVIDSKEVGPFTVELVSDYDGGSWHEPAKDYWEQGIQFVTWERNSTLSDLHNWTDKDAVRRIGEKNSYVFNLYKYEHSLVAYNVSGFSCPWDSGQVGYLIIPKNQADDWESARKLAESVCDEITDWCNGNYVGFVVRDQDGDVLDSCWGFRGGDSEYAFEQGVDAAEYELERYYEKEARKLEETRPDLYAEVA